MNKNQLIPIKKIEEKFEAISLNKDKIVYSEVNLNDGTIKDIQQLEICYDEIALSTLNDELCISEIDIKKKTINFHRFNLKTFSNICVLTLDLNNYFCSEELNGDVHYSKLIYLNTQYLLYFVTKSSVKHGQPFYQYIFLINTTTGEIKILNPKLPNGDNLLRLDIFKNIYLSNDDHYLLLKTGRIMAYEKKTMYEKVDTKSPYYDHIESIYIIEVSSLIELQNFDNVKPIALLNYSCSSDKIRYENNTLSYVFSDFTNNNQELIKHDLLTESITKFQDDQAIQEYLQYEIETEPSYYHFVAELFKQEKNETFILIDNEFVFDLKLKKII
ncbi:hypothetical protein [Lysinibacillus xylanilyticus]|uniref:hypothetical protein n=1 Tax=Lysinibacillus xylanilyticus TaxID=582475 RepID=UPI003CFDA962